MALTLRLTEDDEQTLERIKATTGNNTASAALKQMIQQWEALKQENRHYQTLSAERGRALHQLRKSVQNKLLADQVLSEMAADDSIL